MRKLLFILFISLCFAGSAFAICGPAPTPGGDWVFPGGFCDNILLVCPTSEYTTIGEAMAAADSWDTILVAEGTYSENVTYTQNNLTLRAFGSKENTIITSPTGTVVSFSTKYGCTLDGFTVSLTAATDTADRAIYSNNNSASAYTTVKNCKILADNNGADTLALYAIDVDNGNFALLNNKISISQKNHHAIYAIQNTADHTSKYIGNELTISQASTGANILWGFQHHAGAGSIMYCEDNIITINSTHTLAGIGYGIYASAELNYVDNNVIDANASSTGEMYGVYTGAAKTAYYNGNTIEVTVAVGGDGEWANFGAGTSYANGNIVTGDGVMGTGGTIYEGINQINGTLSIDGIVYNWPADNGDAGEQLQTDGAGVLSWEDSGVIADDAVSSTHINWAEPITVPFDNKVQFGDTGIYIWADDDGILDIVSDTTIESSAAWVHTGNFWATTYGSDGSVSDTELKYVDFTSSGQTQMDLKTIGDASVTDNHVATFNLDGYNLQDTLVVINDAGAVTGLTSMTVDASETPGVTGYDSGVSGDDIWKIYGDAVGDDANDAHTYLQTEEGNALVTYITLDGTDEEVQLAKPLALGANGLATTGIISHGSQTPLTGDADLFDDNFTGAYLYGGTYICNGAGTAILPLMAVGMNFTIITLGAIAVVIDTNINDGYLADGTTGVEGAQLTNTSTAGNMAVIQYYTADDWLITTDGWTPG